MFDLEEIEEYAEKGKYHKSFWKLVDEIKKGKFKEHIDFVGRIDEKVYRKRTRIKVGISYGNSILLVLLIISIFLLTRGGYLFLLGALCIPWIVHPLAHYIVGKAYGIDFLFYFPNGPAKIEPTLKIDYATYLRASARKRAYMHASGVIATLSSAFLMVILSFLSKQNALIKFVLIAYFLILLITDLAFSPKFGDLKRYKREMRYVRD